MKPTRKLDFSKDFQELGADLERKAASAVFLSVAERLDGLKGRYDTINLRDMIKLTGIQPYIVNGIANATDDNIIGMKIYHGKSISCVSKADLINLYATLDTLNRLGEDCVSNIKKNIDSFDTPFHWSNFDGVKSVSSKSANVNIKLLKIPESQSILDFNEIYRKQYNINITPVNDLFEHDKLDINIIDKKTVKTPEDTTPRIAKDTVLSEEDVVNYQKLCNYFLKNPSEMKKILGA